MMYQTRYEDCQKKSNEITSQLRQISFCRLISCVTAGVFFCLGYSEHNTVYYLLSAAVVLCFLLLVRFDHRLKERQNYLMDYQSVLNDYHARLGDDWKEFAICGTQYLQDDAPQTSDLDIFGKCSLYQYLCTASTVLGQDQLALWLSQTGPKDVLDIQNRQQAVRELAEKTDFFLRFEATARNMRAIRYETAKKNLEELFQSLEPDTPSSFLGRAVIWVFPALTLASACLFLLGIFPEQMLACFLVLAALQLMAAFLGHAANTRLTAPVYRMNQSIAPYCRLIELLLQESFESPYLKQLQQLLSQKKRTPYPGPSGKHTDGAAAVKAFKELKSIADSVVIRHNVYAYLLFNSLFSYDFHCARRYRRWKATYQNVLRPWLEAVGSIEAFISLGVIAHTRQTHIMPRILDTDNPVLSADGLQHPLLKEPDAVGNDFHLTHHICIITGSNMSGKTTFMRSIGVNLLLAYAGGYCTASRLDVSCMALCTSMRTADNVSEGISSFYAELLCIQKITETCKKKQPMLSLIDEIYKGTNSKDRIYAASETLKSLAKPYAVTLLTTHDFELCDLEQDTELDAENYYFCEHYSGNQILFDYKIRKGRCRTANARFLLRMAGILPQPPS